jgi:hypothetical protein
MKRSNISLTMDEISTFWSLLATQQPVLVVIITIREGLSSFFLVVTSTTGGEIYLCFLSRCSDEEEQQFFVNK